jgi:hypothetical protein
MYVNLGRKISWPNTSIHMYLIVFMNCITYIIASKILSNKINLLMFQYWNLVMFQYWNLVMFQYWNLVMFQYWNLEMFQSWNLVMFKYLHLFNVSAMWLSQFPGVWMYFKPGIHEGVMYVVSGQRLHIWKRRSWVRIPPRSKVKYIYVYILMPLLVTWNFLFWIWDKIMTKAF